MRRLLAALVLVGTGVVVLAGAPADASPTTWYVRANSDSTAGDGTASAPFGSFAQVERRSRAGDTIVVLPGKQALDGGVLSADVVRYDVSAQHNWWGQESGPKPLQSLVVGGSLDSSAPLPTAPGGCPAQ